MTVNLSIGETDTPGSISIGAAMGIESPRRMSVSDAAEKYTHNHNGPWSAELTPYMIQPMNAAWSRAYTGVVYIGPARSGKTQAMAEGWLSHSVMCDPGDMAMYFPTEENARDFSYRRINRLHQFSKDMNGMLSKRGHDNNIMRKRYRNGMLVDFMYPASSQLAQREFKRVLLSDYDAMPQDVSGEGSPFDLAQKRTQTFLSSGSTVVESSPRFEVIKRGWVPQREHEAPPVVGGILPLYNRGDRRRWYWRCLSCSHPFEAPPLPSYILHETDALATIARTAHVPCPMCGYKHIGKDKKTLNNQSDTPGNQWVAAGQTMQPDGSITGDHEETPIASFWAMGCSAAFQPWESLVLGELQGLAEVESKGAEETLRTKRNIDQGIPYIPQRVVAIRTPEQLQQQAEDLRRGFVPDDAKIVTAAIDVQGNRFVVQVQAWGPGYETWIIDRFDVALSGRTVDDMPQAVNPGGYLDDWKLLIKYTVKSKKYHNANGEIIPIAISLCDSGGQEGVAYKAYDFWRWCRNPVRNYTKRIKLLKGVGTINAPPVIIGHPESRNRGKRSAARGDIPVAMINTNQGKDAVDKELSAKNIHLPRWADMSFFEELCAEARDSKGKWEKVNPGDPNETLDLCVYNRAAIALLGADKWGEEWERAPTYSVIYDDVPRGTLQGTIDVPRGTSTHPQSSMQGAGFAPEGWGF